MKAKKETNAEKKKEITVKANKKGRHVSGLQNFLRIFVAPILWLIYPFRYYGNKKVKDGACIYVCNHYHWFDPWYPLMTTWEGIHFMAKKEIRSQFIIGYVADKMKSIWVNRDGKDVRGLMDAIKCLKNNEKINIFPEGTRNKTNEPFLPFKAGAAMLSIRTKTPIIPMVFYEKPKPFKMAHVLVGEPIEFTEYYDKKLSDEDLAVVDQKILQILTEMRENHRLELQAKKGK